MADFQPNPRAANTLISGFRGPENIVAQNVIADIADELFLYAPKKTPLITMTGRLKDKRKVTQSRFDWIEGDEYPRELVLTAAALVGDTTLDVTAGDDARTKAGDIYMCVRTREHIRTVSTASAVVTVTRAIDGGNQVDLVSGDVLVLTAYVAEDGADIATAKSTVDVDQFNYTEIIRTEYSLTGRDIAQSLYTGRDLPATRRRKAIEHAKSMELRFMFGKRASTSGSSHLITYTGGVEYWIRSNVWDLQGVSTIDPRGFDEFLEEAMRWGDGGYRNAGMGNKYLFCGSSILTELNWMAKSKLEYRTLDDTIGLSCMTYNSQFGKLNLIGSPILDYNHKGWAFLLDLNHVNYVYMQDRDTQVLENRQGPGIDGISEEIRSDVGCEVTLEASCALIKRFKEAA